MSIAVLVNGQSNPSGQFGPAPIVLGPSSKFKAWDLSTKAFELAELGQSPFFPASSGITPNNFAYVFCMELVRHFKQDVYLVLLASGGKKIEYFLPDSVLNDKGWTNTQTSPLFGPSLAQEIMGSTGDAKTALTALGKSHFDICLMHQGEANCADPWNVYLSKLEELHRELDDRSVINYGSTYILLGHIDNAYGSTDHATAIEAFAAAHPRTGTVEWDGIELVGGGNVHANGWGLDHLGRRYFNKYLELSGHWPI